MNELNFFCNKRYDISFSDFHKLIQLILPTTIISRETRGIYRQEYQPCNIIELYNKTDLQQPYASDQYIASIYSWLGRRGLTVLADTSLTTSLCREVLKEVKQNPEDFATYSFPLLDELQLISTIDNQYRIFKQVNTSDDISKYIIKEYVGDEANLEFFKNSNTTRLYGDTSSLLSYMLLLINSFMKNNSENTQINQKVNEQFK